VHGLSELIDVETIVGTGRRRTRAMGRKQLGIGEHRDGEGSHRGGMKKEVATMAEYAAVNGTGFTDEDIERWAVRTEQGYTDGHIGPAAPGRPISAG
jgi:hypothetical protein